MSFCKKINCFRVIILVSSIFLASCATSLKPGAWVQVPVTTNPPGAKLYVVGYWYTSPAVVWVPRGMGDFKLTILKRGYYPAHVFLRQSADHLLWGNLWLGPVGIAADMYSGAAYDVEPEIVDVVLTPKEPDL